MYKIMQSKFIRVLGLVVFFYGAMMPSIAISGAFWYPNYEVSEYRVDSPYEFATFLNYCSLDERIILMQSLGGLTEYKIKKRYFGELAGLWDHSCRTFNDVSVETVRDAIYRGILDQEKFSANEICRRLLWCRHNKAVYLFVDHDTVDYHNDIVMWVAKKQNVKGIESRTLGTMQVERKIAEKFFADIWDKLDENQRLELLTKIESDSGRIDDKVAIASLHGVKAIALLNATVAFTHFTFYKTMSIVIHAVAGLFGVTLPFAVYTGASTIVGILTGPIGWLALGSGAFLASRSNPDLIANFVVTVNMLKSKWAYSAQVMGND